MAQEQMSIGHSPPASRSIRTPGSALPIFAYRLATTLLLMQVFEPSLIRSGGREVSSGLLAVLLSADLLNRV